MLREINGFTVSYMSNYSFYYNVLANRYYSILNNNTNYGDSTIITRIISSISPLSEVLDLELGCVFVGSGLQQARNPLYWRILLRKKKEFRKGPHQMLTTDFLANKVLLFAKKYF